MNFPRTCSCPVATKVLVGETIKLSIMVISPDLIVEPP
jgi:hypothetical protein